MDLRNLWALHQIDHALLAIRAQVQGLDVGQREQTQIDALQAEKGESVTRFKALSAELKRLEDQSADLNSKAKRINDHIYGGKPISPKEVQGYETELAQIKKQLNAAEEQMLEIMEELPNLEPVAKEIAVKTEEWQAQIAAKRKAAARTQLRLQEEFKQVAAGRDAARKQVSPVLLPQYDALLQKKHGVAMALITPTFNCSECGMKVAGKTVDKVRDGSVVHCESCGRILYWTNGVT